MVRNLLKKTSLPFVVWNRSSEACSQLATEYPDRVTVVSNPGDVIRASNTTYCMLSTAEASCAVVRHCCYFFVLLLHCHECSSLQYDCDNGIMSAVSEGKVIVDCATLAPDFMQEIEKGVLERGGHFLEAPVSGNVMVFNVIYFCI